VVNNQPPEFTALPPHRTDEVAGLAQALQQLHAELSRRLSEQQQATERYGSLFHSAPVAICVLHDDRFQLANAACLTLYGAPSLDALREHTSLALCHPDDQPRLLQRQRQLRALRPQDPPPPLLEHRLLRLDGSVAEVESIAMPMPLGEAGGPQARGVQVVLHDVTAQRQAQALLREREAQLQLTSRMAHVGGWTLDTRAHLGTWTDELAAIYELPPDTPPTPELALSYFRGDDLAQLKTALRRLLQSGQPYDLELRLHPPSGRLKWVRAQASAVLHEGRVVQLRGVTQDITERRAAQEALQELNAQLEQRVAERTAELRQANAELDAFAYAVSHDLRAPLRAMSGFSQALVEDHGPALPTEAREHIEQIIQGSRRMGELIEGLLALSRSVRGLLRSDEVDLSALAEQAVAELRRAEPGRAVEVRVEPGLRAQGDRRMLAAALGNLLGNAWKYTSARPDARIELAARQVEGECWFCVTDNGAGFDMAHAGRLFKVFARLHRHDEFPGLGIGLATVQRIIQRHGGRVEAEATPGLGASFRFTLPARKPAPASESAEP
jgi:PAS domain S-box-containing protein